MNLEWSLVLRAAWRVFLATTVYAYASAFVVSLIVGIRTKGDREKIHKSIQEFIVTPLHIAILFSLFALVYFWQGTVVMRRVPTAALASMVAIGVIVMAGHLTIEFVENTFIRRNPVNHMLKDKEVFRFTGIAILVVTMTTVMAELSL